MTASTARCSSAPATGAPPETADGRQVLAVGDGVPVGKIRLHVLRILARGGMPAGGEIVKQTHARRGSAFQCGIFQQSGIDIGLQLAYVQL